MWADITKGQLPIFDLASSKASAQHKDKWNKYKKRFRSNYATI